MMKVITWNLNYWQQSSVHDDAWDILRKEIKPDLALLQEVNPPRLHKDECLSFQPIHQAWGTAIYSRNLPLEELKIEVYVGRVVAAKLEIPSGEKIIVVSIHAPIINHRVFTYLGEIFGTIEKIVDKRTFVVGGARSPNLEIKEGELFSLLGPNGAGKTTTINILCGILKPTKGTAIIAGFDVTKNLEEIKKVIGVCPQLIN